MNPGSQADVDRNLIDWINVTPVRLYIMADQDLLFQDYLHPCKISDLKPSESIEMFG